jgi:hypothetical protein
MSDRIIIQSGDEGVARYLDASQPFHQAYAKRCGADYWRFDGRWHPDVHPAWNRLPMALRALTLGYERVLWLDADTLVVQPDVNVFDRVPSDSVFSMRRTAGGFYWPLDGPDQWEGYNDGVLMVNDVWDADTTVNELWARAFDKPLPHHAPTLWELNVLLDYAKANDGNPACVKEMDERFNWQPFADAAPENEAVIKAWHGMPHEQRWQEFSAAVDALELPDLP